MDTIRLARKELNGRVPLIGFVGSPWTLANYMIEGRGTKDFLSIKMMMYSQPSILHALLDKIAHSVIQFCEAQIQAGAQAIQIFDTWGGILTPDDFKEFSLRYIEHIVRSIKTAGRAGHRVLQRGGIIHLRDIAEIGTDVVGLDWISISGMHGR